MPLSLLQTATNVAKGIPVSFNAIGGTAPYVYSIVPGGAGGTINPDTGAFTSPEIVGRTTVKVVDADLEEATAIISTMHPPNLFCDVIRREMGLSQDQVYLWDQEIKIPPDTRLYIVPALVSGKSFSNRNQYNSSNSSLSQSVNVSATMDVHIFSSTDEALVRKEEILMAMKSNYGANQMALNSFYFAPLSVSLINVSDVDGSKIPYHYILPIRMNYAVTKLKSVPYFDDFETPEVLTDA